MDYLAEAKKAVERTHGCTAAHVETVAVREVFQGKIAWEGDVEVFAIAGHPKAKRCYAWGYANEKRGGKFDFVTVLEIPPVESAQTAVKVAIGARAKAQTPTSPRLSLGEFKRLFSEVLTLAESADAISGSFEGATLRVVKGAGDSVPTAELITPPTEGEHASRYSLLLSLFFFGALREHAKTDLASWIRRASDSVKSNGEFAQICAGVLIRIYYEASSERVHVIAETLPG